MADPMNNVFQPLNRPSEIRLLYLDAAKPTAPLTGRLEHTTLTEGINFEALSYEWGCSNRDSKITLQGGSSLLITRSLYDALQDLRYDSRRSSSPRVLWADAICINQEDHDELAGQVSIMGSIYRNATQVVTYIGPERDDSSTAIAFSMRLYDYVCERRDGITTSYRCPPASDPRWAALRALILRTWSSRCWCAQEFILNRNLIMMCGTVTLPTWYLIPDIVQMVVNRELPIFALPAKDEDSQSLTECLRMLGAIRDLVVDSGVKLSLGELLLRAHPFQATDPRDKIYSVLGLAADHDEMGVVVDYNCRTEDLYISIATKIIQKMSDATLLYNCLHVKSYVLPSWVPDWSTWLFGSHGAAMDRGYNSCGMTTPQVSVHGKELHISGALVDKIIYVGEPIGKHYIDLDKGLEERKAFIRSELTGLSRWVQTSERQQGLDDIFWRTLIGNITLREEPARKEYSSLYEAHLDYDGPNSTPETRAAARVFCDAVRRRSRYRKLAVTEKGYVGAVPQTAQVGDWVSMFDGENLLFVVRQHRPNFEYVGHAYVHGLMNGELFDQHWYKTQTIILV
ncbi:ankyrin and HET domain-containing protein [Nemania sp. FL0031]|nr:ankyrin and HET domain-containing protein [Nemania sp. FL0031]